MSAPRTIELLCCEAEGCGWTQLSAINVDPETGQRRHLCGHIGTGRRITFVHVDEVECLREQSFTEEGE